MACKYKYKDKWYSEIEVKNQLLKDISLNDVIVELSSQMSYTVEINTAKVKDTTFSLSDYDYELDNEEPANSMFELEGYTYNNDPRADYPAKWADDRKVIRITSEEYYKAKDKFIEKNKITYRDASYYSNLTVPGGTNGSYREQNFETPLIKVPKSHAQFNTENTIGFSRNDDRQIYTEKDVNSLLEVMQKSGILEIKC